jgi:hypothetical protein
LWRRKTGLGTKEKCCGGGALVGVAERYVEKREREKKGEKRGELGRRWVSGGNGTELSNTQRKYVRVEPRLFWVFSLPLAKKFTARDFFFWRTGNAPIFPFSFFGFVFLFVSFPLEQQWRPNKRRFSHFTFCDNFPKQISTVI